MWRGAASSEGARAATARAAFSSPDATAPPPPQRASFEVRDDVEALRLRLGTATVGSMRPSASLLASALPPRQHQPPQPPQLTAEEAAAFEEWRVRWAVSTACCQRGDKAKSPTARPPVRPHPRRPAIPPSCSTWMLCGSSCRASGWRCSWITMVGRRGGAGVALVRTKSALRLVVCIALSFVPVVRHAGTHGQTRRSHASRLLRASLACAGTLTPIVSNPDDALLSHQVRRCKQGKR
jgi:hypothetical protein